MIYFFTPYSFEKKLFEAYDRYMNLVSDDDWVCFLDGDSFFFESNFGNQIQDYIDKYPDTGMFVSYASRSAYNYMVPKDTRQESDSIRYHRERSRIWNNKYHGVVKQINGHVSGHLMCIKRSTWAVIRDEIAIRCDGANLLGVDTQITNVLHKHDYGILLMRGIYLLHYYRLVEGKAFKGHLMDNTINVLIRTSDRPVQFARCIESVKNQTYADINIIVSADNDATAEYVKKHDVNCIRVEKRPVKEDETAPYNEYLNDLIAEVRGGWIFILDDDDYLADSSVIWSLVKELRDDNTIYIVRMKWPDGRVIPSDHNFRSKSIVCKDVGMPCFVFHAKHKYKLKFNPVKQGDYDFLSRLTRFVRKQNFIDLIMTLTGNKGAYGSPE